MGKWRDAFDKWWNQKAYRLGYDTGRIEMQAEVERLKAVAAETERLMDGGSIGHPRSRRGGGEDE